MTDNRDNILDALEAFISQKPGLDPRNYISHPGDVNGRRAYFADRNAIARNLKDAKDLLARVRTRSVTEQQLAEAFKYAYSGRLSWDGQNIDYCAGQYWGMEYRAAVCAVLSSALWDYYRDKCKCDTRDKIHAAARRDLPRSLVSRWFN